MAYNSDNRSERLLQGRRFTTDNLTLGQEAFTDVFDLGAGEIFTDDGLIPTGSTQLPYSGSSQNGGIVSGSIVNPSIETDVSVIKYHYRKKLKQAADGQREVYYFTTSDPASVSDTVTSDQLIESDQQTNFVSPKYIIASDSPNTTEAITPGYKVVVYKDTASSAGSITSSPALTSTYTFDYKTGVLTWNDGSQPSSNQFVYITTYQYVGRTLSDQLGGGGASAIQDIFKPTGSFYATTNDIQISGSLDLTGDFTIHGTVTSSLSETVIVNDNIIELNGNESNFGGLSIKEQAMITAHQIAAMNGFAKTVLKATPLGPFISGAEFIAKTTTIDYYDPRDKMYNYTGFGAESGGADDRIESAGGVNIDGDYMYSTDYQGDDKPSEINAKNKNKRFVIIS